jgi:hypothetical protein
MNNDEILKEFPLKDYEKCYKVSNKGKIWSVSKKKYLKTSFSKNNEIFFISKDSKSYQFRVDIIVATCFLGVSDLYLEHVDGDKKNNSASNLRWILTQEFLQLKYGYEWKEISGYDKYYISSNGQVWSSYLDDIISQRVHVGYPSVNIGYPNQKFIHIHRLVAIMFLNNDSNLPIVNHKNGNKLNNNVSNLEWVTSLENNLHSINVLNNRSTTNIKLNIKTDTPDGVEMDKFPGYIITKNGQVYSLTYKRFLKPSLNDNGYYRVEIKRKKYYIHRLVAFAFLNSPDDKSQIQVNHKNLNKLDNNLENLEWVNQSENNKHSAESNPEQYKHLQKKVACINKDTDEIISIYDGIKQASREKNVNSGSIVKACKGVRLSAGNYKWKYI